MAGLSKLLKMFDSNISLKPNKRELILEKTNYIKDFITNRIDELNIDGDPKLTTKIHGSYSFNTLIRPYKIEDRFDIDMGVYISNYDKFKHSSEYYKTKLHSVLYQLKNYEVKNNEKCVRVVYRQPETQHDFHVDVVLLFVNEDDFLLASRNEWVKTNPEKFKNWFLDKCKYDNKEIQSIVRLLKWLTKLENHKLPSGFELTILVARFFSFNEKKEYIVNFKDTVEKILTQLYKKFECKRPTFPIEDLFDKKVNDYKNFQENVLKFFENISSKLDSILENNDLEKSANQLNKLFGNDFDKEVKDFLKVETKKSDIILGNQYLDKNLHFTKKNDNIIVKPTKFYGKK